MQIFVAQNCCFFRFKKKNQFFSKFLKKDIAGPLHNPNVNTQSPILDIFWQKIPKQLKLSIEHLDHSS